MKTPRPGNSGRSHLNQPVWRYYLKFYRGHSFRLLFTVIISMGQSLIILPMAWLIRKAFDELIPGGDTAGLATAGAAIVLLILFDNGATLWTRHIILNTTKVVIQQFREELLKKFYMFSRSYYGGEDRGRLHTVMVQDTERLDVMTNALIAQLVPSSFAGLVLSLALVYLNAVLFLAMISIFPLLVLLNRWLGKKSRTEVQSFHLSFGRFSRGILFALQMMDLTRIQSAESFESERRREDFDDLRRTSGRMAWLRAAYVSGQSATVAVSLVIILIAGGISVVKGHMTIGALLSFYAVVTFLRTHLQTVASCIPQIIEGHESLLTLYELLETKDSRPYSGSRRVDFQGEVRLDSVSFQYREAPVLRDVNLWLRPGRAVAIVGPSGSGKTTIAHLLLGFYRPQKGRVTADGLPFDELDLIHLRTYLGVVPQDPIIFSGTVLENIGYGNPKGGPDRIIEAARLARAHEFIEKLPLGYETPVGESGLLLSGGERQRISLARALYRQPRLLVLDEPSNHLDVEMVRSVMKSFHKLERRPAILILSHTSDLSGECHEIYRLQEGRLVSVQSPGVSLA